MAGHGEFEVSETGRGSERHLGRMDRGEIPTELEFEIGEEGRMTWGDLTQFMRLFRAWYLVAAERLPADVTPEYLVDNFDQIFDEVCQGGLTEDHLLELADKEIPHFDDLAITRISKESPLFIWVLCLLTAATFAAILSGGEVDLSKGRFKLNPLGVGIDKLRDALRKRKK